MTHGTDDPRFETAEVFDEDYLHFYRNELDERADAETDLIRHRVDAAPGTRVLDLACGHGRIARRLAERGRRVTGLDESPLLLDHAR